MATLLDLVFKVSLLMIATGVLIVLMRRTSAASRHVALTAALGAAMLLPVAKWALPALPVFVLAAEPQPAPPPPAEVFAPVAAPMAAAEPPIVGPVDQQAPSVPASELTRASNPSWSWSRVLGILWLLGTATLLVRMTVARIRIRRLTRVAQPIDDARVNARLLEIKTQFGVTRPIALVVSAHEWMPLTWGLIRPTILLPASAATWIETHPMRLDAVLLHEMAHIARWDAAWQRVARVAAAIFWFNPLVWIAARRARLERERACDDAVLAQGLRATDYASDLVAIAQTLALPSRAAESALAMARRSQLEQRVGALLDDHISHRRASRASRLLAIALIVLMLPMSAAQLAARPPAALEPSVVIAGARGLQTPGHGGDDVPARDPELLALVQTPPVANQQAPRPTPSVPTIDNAPASPGPLVGIAWRPSVQNGWLRALMAVEPQQPTSLLDQPAKWKLERDAMFRLLIDRARTFVKNGRTKIEIGTAVPVDMKPLEDTLAAVERSAAAPTSSTTTSFVAVNLPTDAQIAAAKDRFAEAMHNLDAAEVRWDNGLLTSQDISAAVTAALRVLTESPELAPVQIRFVTRAGTNTIATAGDHLFTGATSSNSTAADRNNARALYELLTSRVSYVSASPSDADLIEMLKGAAAVKDDVKRADALLELSARYDLTPEMVTLYVAAARGIASAAERARVFAQPIRVK